MQPYFGMKGKWLTFWVTVACCTDMALFGYDQGVFSGVNVSRPYLDLMGLDATGSLLSTITAIYDIGSFFGAILAFDLGERLGRKNTILLGTSIMLVGAILQISAYGTTQMLVARVVAGIGNGLNTATAPVWQAETSKASMRGQLVVLELVMNIAGFSLSNWVNYGMRYASGNVQWRFPIALQIVFMIVLYATVPWLPESPRWLVNKGRIHEAEQIIADLEDLDVNDPWVVTQSKEVQYAANEEKENAVPFKDLLRGRTGNSKGTCVLRRLFLGMSAQALQQLAGINVTSYYLPTVLEQSVGLTGNMPTLIAACNSLSYLFFGSISLMFVETLGRRLLLITASFGQGCCYLLITALLAQVPAGGANTPGQRACAEASIAFFFLYYVFFGFGFQGVPWLYPAEINSLAMRTRGAALATATNWIVNFMVVEVTPVGIASLGWRFYIIWTVFNFSFVPFVYLFYPETAGRTLEDIDRFFLEGPPLLVFKDKDAISRKRPQRYIDNEQGEYRRHSSAHNSLAEAKQAAENHQKENNGVGFTEKGVGNEGF